VAAPRGALGHPAVAVIASSVVAQLALLVSGPLVVRLLGISGRGELALVWSVVLGTSQVAMLGLPSAVTWFAASRGIDPARIVSALLRGYLVQIALTAVGVGVAVALVSGGGWLRAAVAVAGVVALMLAVLGLSALQGAGRFGAFAILSALPAVLYAAAVAVLFARDAGSVTALLALSLAGWAVVAAVSLTISTRVAGSGGDLPSAVEARAYGRRAMIAGLAPIDTLGLEQVLLGLVTSHYVLGLFVVGWAFETGPVMVLAALAAFVGPRLSALAGGRPEFVRRWLLIAVGLGVAVCAAIQVVLAPVLVWAFGAAAEPAVDLARVLTVAGVFLGLRRITSACLVGLGRATEATCAELVGLATMVLGMLMMTLAYDPIFPGLVLIAAGAVTLLGQSLLLVRTRGSAGHASP
jgi:O-antigen/teichoic acid export membrane protein